MKEFWSLNIHELCEILSVKTPEGLSQAEASRRLEISGANRIEDHSRHSPLALLWKQMKTPFVLVLFLAGVAAFLVGEGIDTIAIFAILLMNILIGFFQESKAEASLQALAKLSAPYARVLREGRVMTIEASHIVPGDVVVLEAGDLIPADARLFSSEDLRVDEGLLTGESLPVKKMIGDLLIKVPLSERSNSLFSGTAVINGSARALVVKTGMETEMGQIARLMAETERPLTPLQKKLQHVGNSLLLLGGGIVVLVFIIGLYQGRTFLEVLMLGLSLAVSAIPEGLPTVVTVALVLAVRRMSHRRALIRKLDSVEVLGSTDIICTDKTGTLTTGVMSVRETIISEEIRRDLFFQNLILCNNASLTGGSSGDSTEVALLEFAQAESADAEEYRRRFPRIKEWPFESVRKRMSVAVKEELGITLLVKGAPEEILSRCDLSSEERLSLQALVANLADQGMRIISHAYARIEAGDLSKTADEVERKLCYLGLSVLADPPRKESAEAIRSCRQAGIRVVMMTGDHARTAMAIAREIGIIENSSEASVDGPALAGLPDEELLRIVRIASVFSRVSPSDKLRLVSALQSDGSIVAMTGDGVNDAPALKSADIGISMGKRGTEVARQASSMVLTDDNFATIVDAIEEGRAVNGNIRRSLQYLLSTNLAELLFILLSVLGGLPVPLLPVNILWLNLVTDGLPAIALAAEKVPRDFLKKSTKPSADGFFDGRFLIELFTVGLILTVFCFGVYSYALDRFSLASARTYGFSFLTYAVLFRSFCSRSESVSYFSLKPSWLHLASVFVPVILQIVMQRFEWSQEVFSISLLSLGENLTLIGLALIPVIFYETIKLRRAS